MNLCHMVWSKNIMIKFRAKRPPRPISMEDKGPKTSQRLGPASSNPDYTGFAHLLTSGNQSDDDENISVRDNVSLSEQMTDLWLSKANEIQKDSRPNKKPPKPPGK